MSDGKRSPNADKLKFSGLKGKVAIISGATRGIGRECALALAREGCHIAIAAKSVVSSDNLPGTVFSVADECRKLGVEALPVVMDMLVEQSVIQGVEIVAKHFGRIDICINNASALWWQRIEDTPLKKFDLITRLNARGSFLLTQQCLPHMEKNNFGRVITMSPPIERVYKAFGGLAAYNISKFGMTMVAMGVAAEYESKGITGNSLWPATVIESQAAINFDLGERKTWRKATILADATVAICSDGSVNGQQLIDDDFLISKGLSKEDLKCYRYEKDFEPPRLLAEKMTEGIGGTGEVTFKRGDVHKLDQDKSKDVAVSKL